MIILFDEAEKSFTSLGLGILRDAMSCSVEEKLNDTFELTMTYPVTGQHYSKIRIGRIVFAKPNPYDEYQPFRIYAISKPLKGTVTISAFHISYDMNGIPCKAINAKSLNEALAQIQNGAYIPSNFNLKTNISISRTFKTTAPYNMRALLLGDEENSLVGVYNGEIKFDKFEATIYQKRGKNRGAQVCYGHNMTDLTHETNTDLLYNGVFPYYHKETTSTETVTEDKFTQVYIVGSKPFQDGWLSYSKDGEPYHPLDSTPVQIATEGEYYEKVYAWNSSYQKYEEKIYNQSVTLVEGVVSPSWIVIDWSKFPVVSCRANAKGYYKIMTDDKWSDIKGVGDVIFEGNILTGGLNSMASNMIIYFSEVIPSGSESTNKEVSEIVDVVLDDPIIKVNTSDANQMKFDRVLSLDLTSEFDEEPSKDKLKNKAEEYIAKNKIGTVKHNTTVSFVDVASTTEANKYTNFSHIELGDTVRVIYKDLGVDVELRVISTKYDVISAKYDSIELGTVEDKFSSQSIQNGDSISSLTNDVGYADITTVNKLIADTITAEFIQAVNAKLTTAQIQELQVAKIECSGIIEASQFVLDELVAKLLIADNAKISETLEAGNIKVAGDITVNSGEIKLIGPNGTEFIVDREGNVTANSMQLTGGTFNINDGMFEVTNDGILTAKAGKIGDCEIDEDGHLKVPVANIEGKITAGNILVESDLGTKVFEADSETGTVTVAGFKANDNSLKAGAVQSFEDDTHNGVYIGTDGIRLKNKFSVDSEGAILSESGLIGGWVIGSDSISSDNIELKAKGSIKHTGGKWEIKQNGDAEFQSLTANTGGSIGGWEIKSWGLSKNNIEIRSDGSIKNGDNWYINSSGNAKFNNITCQSTWSFGKGKNTWSSASGFSFSLGSLGSNTVNDNGLGFTKGTVGLGTASKGNNGISWNGTKCIIAGDIYANNGYFEGEIKATSGSFKGEIEANKFSFDDGNGHTMSMGYSSNHPSVSGLNIGSGGIKVGDSSGQGLSDIQFVSSITDVSVTVNTGLTNTKVSVGVSYNVRKFTFSSGVCTGLTSSEGKIESGSGQG